MFFGFFLVHNGRIGEVEKLEVLPMVCLNVEQERLVVGYFVDVQDTNSGKDVFGLGCHFIFV
jgi:hypothetical protein